MAVYPFCLVPFFPDPLCLSISLLGFLSSCHSFLPTSAVSLAHICLPVVLYHLLCLCLSLFLCHPPASCCTPSPFPPSLLLYLVRTLYIILKYFLLGTSQPLFRKASLSPSILSLFNLLFNLFTLHFFLHLTKNLILQSVFLSLHDHLSYICSHVLIFAEPLQSLRE